MRVIHLTTFWTVILDILAWFILHMAIVLVMVRLPRDRFHPDGFMYRPRSWEKEGRLYIKVFHIKHWKWILPDGARWMKSKGFPKKQLVSRDMDYLETFAVETCRAELTHWTTILMAPFFFLWNKPAVGWIMIIYAVAENLPLIMAQRYNRCRLFSVGRKFQQRGYAK